MADVERGRLVGGALRLRDADRPGGGGVHDALDPGLERALEDDPRAAHVGVEDGLAVGRAQRGAPGDVEDAARRPHRLADGAPVGDVAGRALVLDPVERREVGAAPGQHPQVVAARGERPRQVRADEPGRAGEQRLSPLRADRRCSDARRGCIAVRLRSGEHGRRHRHDGVSPRGAGRRARHPPGQPLRHPRRRTAARERHRRRRVRRLLRAPAAQRARARRPPSRRSATSSRSTSRCSPTGARSSRSTSRPGSPAPTARPCRPASS